MAAPFQPRTRLEAVLGTHVTISEIHTPTPDNAAGRGDGHIDQAHRHNHHHHRRQHQPQPAPAAPAPADDDEGVWQQDSMSEDEDDLDSGTCTEDCFGCGHLPTGAMSSSLPTLHQSQITYLVAQMKAGLFPIDPTTHAREISRIYEEKIRMPANRQLKPGQTPLPPWTPNMVKKHLEKGNHPLLKWRRNVHLLDRVKEDAYAASKEKHSKNRTIHGGVQKRRNPVQWKILKEAIQEQNKMFKDDLRSIVQNYDNVMDLMRDDTALIDVKNKPIAHHAHHAAIAYQRQNQGILL